MFPRASVFTCVSSKPVIVTDAGFVPCAVSGMTTLRRCSSSPRSAKYARTSMSPVISPCEPAAGWSDTASRPVISVRISCSRHSSSSAPCAPSSSCNGWRNANPGRPTSRSLMRGLYFIVHEPSG